MNDIRVLPIISEYHSLLCRRYFYIHCALARAEIGAFMRRLGLVVALSLCFSACQSGNGCTFETDALCPTEIARACHQNKGDLKAHFLTLNDGDKAQAIAQMEAIDGCVEVHSWVDDFADEAYRKFGAAFYHAQQPWHFARAKRALDDIEKKTERSHMAAEYLRHHKDDEAGRAFLSQNLSRLVEHADDDAIFALLAEMGDAKVLEKLSAMDSTPERDKMLIVRWQELPKEVQKRVLRAYMSVHWAIQSSGSSQLPQYLVLDWAKYALPEGTPDFVVALRVDSIKIKNDEVRRGQLYAAEAFKRAPLRDQGAHHIRFDLQPWLLNADTYRITARAHRTVWPANTPDSCFEDSTACQVEPLFEIDDSMDKTYRVFIGVDTGAPSRIKSDSLNAEAAKRIRLDLCNSDECIVLYDKKPISSKVIPKLTISQGHDFYIRAELSSSSSPVASRLMARTDVGKAWREIATFYANAPIYYPVAVRGDVDLGSLCGKMGACSLQLQLRPSLRMARRDPFIERYFGGTIDLGTVTLDIQNLTARQIWNEIDEKGI